MFRIENWHRFPPVPQLTVEGDLLWIEAAYVY